jgi:tRNA A-37 threonylcarbamoyl transferase component Bud32
LNHARSDRVIYKDEDKKPEKYALLDQAEAMQPGPERDAVIDRLTEIINSGGTIMEPYIPPTTGGPEYTQAVGGGQRPSIDAPYAERRAALQASIDTGAHAEETLAQGAMGETRRFELADGTSAIYKRHTRDWNRGWDYPIWTKTDQTDAEELSAITAEALGVKAPAVTRASDTEIYMELMPGQIGEMRWPHRNTPPKGVVVGQQGVRMGLLDTLIENTDRHGGNYLVDEDENLYAIDHGLAFSKTYEKLPDGTVQRKPVDRFNATGEFALGNFVSPSGNLYDNPLTPADGQKLKRVMADLRDQFEQHGRLGWWEAMNERAQHIAARASGTQDVL